MGGTDSPGSALGTQPGGAGRQSLERHYAHYLNQLIRKERRNRSIRLTRIAPSSTFDVHMCEELVPGTMGQVAGSCAASSSRAISILPDKIAQGLDASDLEDSGKGSALDPEAAKYARAHIHIKRLARNIRQEEEETGEQIGHVGFPFLEGRANGRTMRGPVILFPASLERKKVRNRHGWALVTKEQDPILNLALVKEIEKARGVRLEEINQEFNRLMDSMNSGEHRTLDGLFGLVSAWMEKVLDLHPALRVSEAGAIPPMTEDSVPDHWPLHMANRMAFGKFPQADVDMAGDYRQLREAKDDGGLISDLLGIARDGAGAGQDQAWDGGSGEETYNRRKDDINDVSARRLNTVFPSDTSQDMVILESKSSPITVVKGPPGTGKSQLIVNIAADAMYDGKRVLVVCQKRAALEVVHSRLASAGLDECAVLMNKESDDRRGVYRRMSDAIEKASKAADSGGTTASRLLGTPGAHMARRGEGYDRIIEGIDDTTSELVDIGNALSATHSSGASTHYLHCIARSGYSSKKIAAIDELDLPAADLWTFARRVGELQEQCIKYDDEAHPLHGRRSLSDVIRKDMDALKTALEKLAEISGGPLGEALRARHPCGASAHDVYSLARDGYETLGIPAIAGLDLGWEELEPLARRVGEMREGCVKYDDEAHPLHGRRSLAGAPAGARERLHDTLAMLEKMSGGPLGDALRARHPCGASAHDVYSLARDGYETLGIPAIAGLDLGWEELEPLARRVGEMREGCVKYDDEAHPLHGRRSLAGAPAGARERLHDTLARLADISESVIVCQDPGDQKDLCDILDTWGKRFPWALHRRGAARSSQRLAGRAIDEANMDGERLRARGGVEWWEKFDALREFFTDSKMESLKHSALPKGASGAGDYGKQEWTSMLEALGEYDQIRAHDARKDACPGRLLGVLELLRKNAVNRDWGDAVTQETCLKWIAELRVKHPMLAGTSNEAESGREWSSAMSRLGEFFEGATAARLEELAGSPDSGHAHWNSMLRAMEEYDQMASHDTARENSPQRVLDVLEGLRTRANGVDDWADAVTQEFCLKWIADLDRERPGLSKSIGPATLSEWAASIGTVCGFFDGEASARLRESAATPDSGHARWASMLGALADYEQIQEYDRDKARLPQPMARVVDALRVAVGAGGDWEDIVTQEVCLRWINDLDAGTDTLRGDPLPRYDRLRARLRDGISQQQGHVRESIVSRAQGAIKVLKKHSPGLGGEEARWRDFSREVGRKRGKPVRILFEKYAENFLAIAPCWLMSPAAACRILPLQKGLFDLVIVDEASQLTVERSLPVLYRGRRAVIAGDDKQLTPFDLFQARYDDEDDDEIDTFGEESLFDKASAMCPTSFLSWHYRSKYQELIDFSNHAFYAGNLNVAPNVVIHPKDPPIRWIQCNGVWANQKNSVEVHKSVELVYETWKNSPSTRLPSVAIVTFNVEQRDAILDEIENRYENDDVFHKLYDHAHSGDKAESLIVRNIENIQGDERDVVIFSIAYARAPDNVFRLRGGSLFTKGSENRLNVAITRARESMLVVVSLNPSDIKGTYTHLGPKRLRQFLEYAKATSERDEPAQKAVLGSLNDAMEITSDQSPQKFESPFEESVAKELASQGYTVHTQIGESGYRIDLAIVDQRDPTRYVVGIECDGAMFHSARSARERDVLRQDFLENRGWVIERVWSTNWYRNRPREVARITSRINEIYGGRD